MKAQVASAQIIALLRDTLISETQAARALEAEIKWLRLKLDAEIASKKRLQVLQTEKG